MERRTDRQTDMTKLISAFRNSANAPKNLVFCPHVVIMYSLSFLHKKDYFPIQHSPFGLSNGRTFQFSVRYGLKIAQFSASGRGRPVWIPGLSTSETVGGRSGTGIRFSPVNPVILCIVPATLYAYLRLDTDLITRTSRRSL